MSGLSNGQQAILMLLVFILPVWVTWTANSSPLDRTAISLLISATLSGVLAFIKELLGGKPAETSASTVQPSSPARTMLFIRSFPSKFKFFLSSFAHDTTARSPRRRRTRGGKYDPAPRRKGPRRGVEPAGLKRWRLSHRRTHDPGYSSTYWSGPRGGHYFKGPRKKRYDPQPRRRFSRARGYASRAGRGIEGALNKWGTALGLALGMGAGAYIGYNEYVNDVGTQYAWQNYQNTVIGGPIVDKTGKVIFPNRPPEVTHLWATNDPSGYNTLPYLQYKLLGTNPQGQQTPSAWVIPFWASFITFILSGVGMRIGRLGKMHRFLRPINKIAKGSTLGTLIGALVLPGCGKHGPQGQPAIPPPPNTLSMTEVSPGHFAQAQVPMIEYTYRG